MNEYKFELDKSLIEPFLTDFKNDAKTKNARNIQGTGWINPIIYQIKIIENNDETINQQTKKTTKRIMIGFLNIKLIIFYGFLVSIRVIFSIKVFFRNFST